MDIKDEISNRACLFTEDNLPSFQARIRAGDDQIFVDDHFVQLIKSAMYIGASIVLEQGVPPIPGETEEGWKHVEKSFEAIHREGSTTPTDTGVVPPAL